jgi:DNA recombination protein RmuC
MLYGLIAIVLFIAILMLFLIIMILRSQTDHHLDLLDKISNNNSSLQERILVNNSSLLQELSRNHQVLVQSIDNKLMLINSKVEEKLTTGFADNRKIFIDIMSSLTKIDAAQKNIESLSGEVISLQDILSGNKKARGIFGEVQLAHILHAVFGEASANNKYYQLEYTLSNSRRCDAIIFAPEPLGKIAIDAKFPLENYQKLQDYQLSEMARKEAEKTFISDVKKHIDKIAQSYLIAGETSEHAIMFIPAEGIFAFIHAYCNEIIMHASKQNVWVTAPSTMMATLSTIQVVIKESDQRKNFFEMQKHLRKLGEDFLRYDERWKKLARQLDTVQSSAREIEISSNKITHQFKKITNSNFELDQHEEVDSNGIDEQGDTSE